MTTHFQQLVDQVKIDMILDMVAHTSVRELCTTFGHKGLLHVIYSKLCKDFYDTREDILQRYEVPLDTRMSGILGHIEGKVGNGANLSVSRLEKYFPCSCRRIIIPLDTRMSGSLGHIEGKVGNGTNLSVSRLEN
jgi:hypothetical protein